jgi:hypothetical protein
MTLKEMLEAIAKELGVRFDGEPEEDDGETDDETDDEPVEEES